MPDQIVSVEPATGHEIARFDMNDAEAAVQNAHAARAEWAATSLSDRVAALRRFAELVGDEAEDLATLIARETGKPLWEARTEVQAVIAKVEISITAFAERTGNKDLPGPVSGALRHKPHGVMAVLGPYNFPAHLPNGHIVPALLAGNVVLFKPSEKTPAVGERLVAFYHRAGIGDDIVKLLIGGAEQGRNLIADRRVDGVLFTGSSTTGIAISKALAERPGTIAALEMGGNNPLIVWDTDRFADAAAIIVQSAYTTAGQRCTAARRLIVKADLYDTLMAHLLPMVDRIVTGGPFDDPQPFMGPVIDNAAADALLVAHQRLVDSGAKTVRPLRRTSPDLPFLSPAILDVTDTPQRSDAEIFGPLLQVMRVSTFDEAIAAANDTAYGLSASLVGGSQAQYDRFWQRSRAGIVNWNRPTNGASSAAPFGGIGLSGNHRPGAYYAADYCSYPVTSTEADLPRAAIDVGLVPG
ncbi:succinylglutamate-semialdehyde dehydrogenase [Croceicoccus sp. F390]|uniref:Succinylglutamate-semialdehyde dehydrogenase n=1 Tax=Croceicoccus esteveae TaxID=3075597 RepID=A0ABU2ZGI4_9SPHN|nr:succinylglutamate-semialdehyde dehydrogenase [Croceicoccus sp. F390]MDT0575331.1 succinylglutamate-semialdehyde dehydrogenase [Croceicoccus sp. F390]